jgi:hypothetical protein
MAEPEERDAGARGTATEKGTAERGVAHILTLRVAI